MHRRKPGGDLDRAEGVAAVAAAASTPPSGRIRRQDFAAEARLPCTYPGAMPAVVARRLPRRQQAGRKARSAGLGRVRFLLLVLPRVIPHSGESPAHRQHANSRGWHQSRSAAHGNVKFVSTTFRFLIVLEYRTFSRLRGSIHILTGGRVPRMNRAGSCYLGLIAISTAASGPRLLRS